MNNKNRGIQSQKTLAALAVSAALMLSMPVAADKTSGALIGHVVVPAGSTLSNVQVTIKHQSKGLTRSTMTNEKGDYHLKALPIGKYTVTLRKKWL